MMNCKINNGKENCCKKQAKSLVLAVGAMICATAAVADGSIDDFYYRYDFTTGVKIYENNGCETEPCTYGVGYTGV